MSNLDAFAAADYLVDGFVEADDAIRRWHESGRGSDLVDAAASLCGTLRRLERDDGFWHAMESARSHRELEPLLSTLDDLDHVLGKEYEVLREFGIGEPAATELVEAIGSVEEYLRWPDQMAAETVREAVGGVRRGVCTRAGFKEGVPSRPLKKAIAIAGGGAVTTINGLARIPVFSEFSTYAGGKLIDLGSRGVLLGIGGFWDG